MSGTSIKGGDGRGCERLGNRGLRGRGGRRGREERRGLRTRILANLATLEDSEVLQIAGRQEEVDTLFHQILLKIQEAFDASVAYRAEYPEIDWTRSPSLKEKFETTYNDDDHLVVYNRLSNIYTNATNEELHLVAAVRCDRLRSEATTRERRAAYLLELEAAETVTKTLKNGSYKKGNDKDEDDAAPPEVHSF